jgi:lysophospholipase L1-like esterase
MNIAFIGDSLTEFFDWQRRFPKHSVVNLGIAGETVEGLLSRIDRVLAIVENPDFIFIMTGINDIAMEDYDIIAAYRKILKGLSSPFHDALIVVQSILPVKLPWIDNEIIKGTNISLKELSHEFHAKFLDLYNVFVDKEDSPVAEYLLDDGVHLSDKGYKKWSEVVESFLATR